MPPLMSRISDWRFWLTLAAGALGGWAAAAVRLPLPWVLGSMLAVAAVTLGGVGATQPIAGRRIAQMTIGVALGLGFTPPVLRSVAAMGHWLVLGAVYSLVLSALAARLFQRWARVDAMTAAYSTAVGASAEMALQAQRAGANGAVVASSHAVRITVVVTLASFIARLTGEHGDALADPTAQTLSLQMSIVFAVLAVAAGWIGQRIRLPNAFLLGPVIMAASFAANGVVARLHPWALEAAQIVIGWGLGQHMTRQFFMSSPRILAVSTAITVAMLGICVMAAAALHAVAGVSLLTAFLSLAPGGTAEMAIIAKTYGIGAPAVTAFHFFRVVATIVLTGWMAQKLADSGWLTR